MRGGLWQVVAGKPSDMVLRSVICEPEDTEEDTIVELSNG